MYFCKWSQCNESLGGNQKVGGKIFMVVGNEWIAGNLSYHLKDRPKWKNLNDKGYLYICSSKKKCFAVE